MEGLKPGDVLLYKPKGFFGWVIALKTWHKVSHVEVYVGFGWSVASRDGKGVGRYQVRTEGLIHVLRPKAPIDLAAGIRWFEREMDGLPYGWKDLLNFAGKNVDSKGIVCSPFAAEFLRKCGLPIFNDEPINKIAPFQFLLSELLKEIPYVESTR